MRKLAKDQIKAHSALVKRLRDAEDKMDLAISDFNAQLEALFAPIDEAQGELNEVRADAVNFRDEIVSDMEEYAGERSDKWQESDAAQTFSEWMGEWESLECEEISIESPPDIDAPDYAADGFEALPLELGG